LLGGIEDGRVFTNGVVDLLNAMVASGITSKPAIEGHLKTGQRTAFRD